MRLLTADEVAARWQVSDKLVYKLAAKGEIPCCEAWPSHPLSP